MIQDRFLTALLFIGGKISPQSKANRSIFHGSHFECTVPYLDPPAFMIKYIQIHAISSKKSKKASDFLTRRVSIRFDPFSKERHTCHLS